MSKDEVIDPVEEILNPAPDETANQDERTLLQSYYEYDAEVEELSKKLKAATIKREDTEDKLLKLLEDDDKKASAKYEGLGYAVKMEGAAHASIEKGRQPEVMNYLKGIDREDLIKPTIASATLSTFVRECLKANEPLPPGVTFYKPKYLKFYKAK